WLAPMEQPTIMPRTATWGWSVGEVGNWIDLKLGVDLYNPSDERAQGNTLAWQNVPPGWVRPRPRIVPSMATYQVTRVLMGAKVNLDALGTSRSEPVELTFTDAYNKATRSTKLILPVAPSEKREGQLAIDGSLSDWNGADAIHNGPLVRMFNRPALQRHELEPAMTTSS